MYRNYMRLASYKGYFFGANVFCFKTENKSQSAGQNLRKCETAIPTMPSRIAKVKRMSGNLEIK